MGQVPSQVQSPFLWVDDDDQLYMRVWGAILTGCTALLTARILRPSGIIEKVQLKVTAPTNRTVNTGLVNVGRGWLLSIIVLPSAGQPERGQVFVNVLLIREGLTDSDAACMFISDYLCYQSYLGYPGGRMISAIEGPGRIRSITGTDPAAGAEISETVPTGAKWRLIGFTFTLVTDATVTQRNTLVTIDDGANVLAVLDTLKDEGLSSTYVHSLLSGLGYPYTSHNQAIVASLPGLMLLLAGWRIRTTNLSLQAGDNYGAPQMWVEEWIET